MRPASVSVPLFDDRSNSCSPSSTSSRRTAWLTAGCVRCTLAAAREKLRSCATARKILSACRSIFLTLWRGPAHFRGPRGPPPPPPAAGGRRAALLGAPGPRQSRALLLNIIYLYFID